MKKARSISMLSTLVGVFASFVTAYGAPKNHNANQNANANSDLVVIQGTIQSINQNTLTVVTGNWKSYPHGDQADGSATYRVNVSHAIEETYAGNIVKPQVGVGEVIVVVGRLAQDQKGGGRLSTALNMNAMIIEQSAGGSTPSGNGVTQTVLRVRSALAHQ